MSKRACTRCGHPNDGEAHVCDPARLMHTDENGKDTDVTTFSERLNTIMKNMGGDDNDPADWMDSWGCCKICGGEIPYGHINTCYVYTKDQEIKELKEQIEVLEDEVARLQ